MIKKVSLYLIIFVIGIFAVREFVYTGIRKNKQGIFEKFNTMFLKQNAYDVLFLGSSRAETHFNPRIFDSVTGHFSYNLGVTGATPRIAFAVLKAYCSKSKAPKYLIFDLDFHFLKHGVDTIRYFPRYFAYLGNEVLANEFSKIDNRFNSFKYNPLYSLPYSNIRSLGASLHGWLNKTGKYDTIYYKGYVSDVFQDLPKTRKQSSFYGFIHPVERQYIDSIIQFSKQNNINLVMVSSPMYKGAEEEMLNKKTVVSQLKNIAKINKLEYWDMSKEAYSNKQEFFLDSYHMTASGARLFTLGFAYNFQQYFDKKPVN
ncbi:MAG: hypothetical protein IPJ32_07770 [Sphingobacteriaceae bacterium]|nr:hypothetical protein [Sphingobacteriaceae bacterium]